LSDAQRAELTERARAQLALDFPDKVRSLVLLAPVSHDWGADSFAWYSKAAAHSLIGPVFSQLIPFFGPRQLDQGIAGTFHPEPAPVSYKDDSGAGLLFRPTLFRPARYSDQTRITCRYAEWANPPP